MSEGIELHSSPRTPARRFLWIHHLVTNWVITDPSYIVASDSPPTHKYQVHNDENTRTVYFLGGRLRYVKLKPISVALAVTIVACGVLFWVSEASWLWHHVSAATVVVYSYLWVLTFLFFVKAATGDPGIQPRNLHLPNDQTSCQAPDEYFNLVSLPYVSDRNFGVSVKYCPTCHIWRLPRMSHCGVCNTCVAQHDHHCVFLNNCIGARNYRYFLWFLLVAVLVCSCQAILCMVHLFHYRMVSSSLIFTFQQLARKYPVALLLSVIGLAGVIYPLMLLMLHLYLTANNYTTREYLNYVRPATRDGNPDYVNVFDTGSIVKNLWLNWVAAPQGISLVRPKDDYVPGDITLESVAPLTAFTHPN